MCSHWFSASQWQLPNERQYLALQALFNRKAAEQGITGLSEPHAALQEEYGTLTALYSELVMQYSELRQQYEN
ncbi:site-specific DNA-methyltransferase, partial [Klebsiella pneumoniae]|nr:site-specific DNA-methyltransferase [Klebsiella pneumoniae]